MRHVQGDLALVTRGPVWLRGDVPEHLTGKPRGVLQDAGVGF